jgi:inosine/xanthosine triphosphatase
MFSVSLDRPVNMNIILGSTSPVKVNATKQAFRTYFDNVQVKALSLPSGVKAFPTTDKETLRGAMNRAEKARLLEPGADFTVGIEGGLNRLEGQMFVHQVAVVLKGDTRGIGISQSFVAPDRLLEQLDMKSDESRRIIDSYFGRDEILSEEGVIGIMTNGVQTRTDASRDAVICALTRFINPKYY